MMKRVIALFQAAVMIVFLASAVSAYGVNASINLDGITLDTAALVDGENVSLPVRDVCCALGYDVKWSDANGVRKITVTSGKDTIEFDLTHQRVTDNGHQFSAVTNTGSGILLISGCTYIHSGLFSTVFPVRANYDAQSGVVTLEYRTENDIGIVTEKLSAQTQYLTAEIQYPQLAGMADESAQTAVNRALKKSAQAALTTGQKNASDMGASIRDGYTGAVGKCETVFDYTVTYNQNGLVSVVMMEYQYAGGAHGSTVQIANTYELDTGDALTLLDMMDGTSDYKACINTSIRQEIDRRVEIGDLYEFEFDPFADIGEDPGYYLSDSAVVIFFQEYEYFPYTAGIQEFAVPYYYLKGMFAAPYSFFGGTVVSLEAEALNTLSAGEIARVVLDGNTTTGYEWHCTVSDERVLKAVNEWSAYSAQEEDGTGNRCTWIFKCKKAGTATITFMYYRAWEGEESVLEENTRVYHVTVV